MAQTQDFEFQLSSVTQLNIIDKLRELGVGEYIGLPQLVVVGDQSSGKSSILEALLGLPFPRDSGLCTRFATQITMRRDSYERITISIIPKPNTAPERSEQLRSFKRDGLTSLDGQEFLDIFQDACRKMSITPPGENPVDGSTTFSNDVLQIELCGPQRENLSIIDIPGIFRTPTPGVTSKADMALVEDMVRGYIKDDKTIILAVLPAPTDIATQSILTMAAEADPQGLRTLGVLTKPDLVDKGGEQNVIDLVRGKRNQLRLGYCVVRNRGQAELSTDAAERAEVENSFFNRGPWASLDKDRVGLQALKERLQELLIEITRREFPNVKQQLDRRLAHCKESFAKMGPDRESTEKQRIYLQEIVTEAQRLTECAIDANYSRSAIFAEIPAMRLPTLIMARNDEFAREIARKGHTISFQIVKDGGNEDTEDSDSESDNRAVSNVLDEELDRTDTVMYPELSDLMDKDVAIPEPMTDGVLKWIEKEYRNARGRGLESIGPAVLPTLWQGQSKNWKGITFAYITDVISYVHHFIRNLLEHVCPDERVRTGLFSILLDHLMERYRKAIDHVDFIVKVEYLTTPMTMNHYFNDNLQKFRSDRLKKSIEKLAISRSDDSGDQVQYMRLDDVVRSTPMGNVEHATLDIHSILKAYYKVARKRFVDNICMQGTDYHLLSGLDCPLRVFSSLFVSSLTPEQLEQIAGEDLSSKRQRKSLKSEIEALEEGRKLLRAV